ncbi:MAG: hypothetical protein M1840_007612 [Geoglossum simile]|nr:MAG: hypothetical protein M1840_007612 [Geoglossum simile]
MSDVPTPDCADTPLLVPRSRPRSHTEALLGPLYVTSPPDTPTVPVPVPLKAFSDYTPGRIREGLSWVDQRLRSTTRKPSPLSAKALLIYKDTCTDALSTTDEEELISLVSTIRTFEESIATKYWLGGLGPEAQAIQDRILAFKRLEFNARYGDYVGRLCSDLRSKTAKLKTEGYELLSGGKNWTDISDIIKLEDRAIRDYKGPPNATNRPPTKTTDAVYLGCADLGLNPRLTLWAIRQYGERNNMMHASLDNYIKGRDFAAVASRLAQDLAELPKIVPPEEEEMETNMQTIIEALIQEWFDTSEDPDVPGAWTATQQLKAYSNLMRDKAESGRIAKEEQIKATAGVARKIIEEREDAQLIEQAMAMQAIEDPNEESEMQAPGPGPAMTTKKGKEKGKGKRLPSSEAPAEADPTARKKLRMASWNKWANMVRQINHHVGEHMRLYGNLKNPDSDPAGLHEQPQVDKQGDRPHD